jgi:PHD/YefM family antitoxin component YafN of YafNO toxin-antitoxin module
MTTRRKKAEPQVIYRRGRPQAVVLDIRQYERLLERLEDWEDVQYLKALRKKPRQFISLEDYLAKRGER